MGLTSLQVCMDSSDWLQGTIHDESGMEMDSSSSPSGTDMLTCSRPLMERRLRPPHDQALKCPRCDSTHTKFCYYNNYSLTQPRYFCKTCRRYWTKGGTLRNIPVGGGCRKNKKISTKKTNNNNNTQNTPGSSSYSHPHPHPHPQHHHHHDNDNHNPTELQLSFPDMQFSHLSNILGGTHLGVGGGGGGGGHYNSMIDQTHRPIDFMERKLEAIVGNNSRSNYDFMGGNNTNYNAMLINSGSDLLVDNGNGGSIDNFHGFCSPFGVSVLDHGNGGNLIDACQRLMLPYDGLNHHSHVEQGEMDVKPTTKLLSLDWQQDQNCPTSGKDTFAYLNSMGSWSNNSMINGYGSSTSTANPLL